MHQDLLLLLVEAFLAKDPRARHGVTTFKDVLIKIRDTVIHGSSERHIPYTIRRKAQFHSFRSRDSSAKAPCETDVTVCPHTVLSGWDRPTLATRNTIYIRQYETFYFNHS